MKPNALISATLVAVFFVVAWHAIPMQAQRSKPSSSGVAPFQVGLSLQLVNNQPFGESTFQVPAGSRLNLQFLTLSINNKIEIETFVEGVPLTHVIFRNASDFNFERPLDLWADDTGPVTVRLFNNSNFFNETFTLTLSGDLL